MALHGFEANLSCKKIIQTNSNDFMHNKIYYSNLQKKLGNSKKWIHEEKM